MWGWGFWILDWWFWIEDFHYEGAKDTKEEEEEKNIFRQDKQDETG